MIVSEKNYILGVRFTTRFVRERFVSWLYLKWLNSPTLQNLEKIPRAQSSRLHEKHVKMKMRGVARIKVLNFGIKQ